MRLLSKHEAVALMLHFDTVKTPHLGADDAVVHREEINPVDVSHPPNPFSGAFDVTEHDRDGAVAVLVLDR